MNSRSTTVDLRPDHLATVNAILLAQVPDYEVWAFGSRANWTAKDSSDLDLAIASKEPVPVKRLRRLQRTFEESYLPLKVDVVDLSKASPEFRGLIEKQHVVLRKPKTDDSSQHSTDREWRSLPLEDALETLIDYRGKTPKKVTQGIPLITARIIKGGRIETPEEFISSEDYEGWMRRGIPSAGDVLLTTEAPLGEVAQLDDRKVALAQRVVALRGKKGLLENDFLKYLLQSSQVQDQLKSRASGTTVQGIKQSELRKISLSIPPLDQQRSIAHTLGLLDKKIELNRRMNETLEAMAQELFRSWFVRPNQPIERKGWRVSILGKHIALRRGTTYKSALKERPGPYLLGLSSIQRNGGFRRDSLSTYGGGSSPDILLRPGDLYVSLKDVTQSADLLGAVARVPPDIKQGRLTQDTVKLLFTSGELSPHYVYRALRSPEYREYCRARATGTTNLGLSREDFLSYEIVIAPDKIKRKFDSIVQSLESRIDVNDVEIRILIALRHALLPKLLSGELRIKDAERIIGEQA